MNEQYVTLSMGAAVLATIGLYSVLYKENKMFRFFEHMYLGLAVGWAIVAIWTETLHDQWWVKITGSANDGIHHGMPGYWAWVLILPIGLLGYLVFSRKYNWMSRIPIGIILGFWAGQQAQAWKTQYGRQIYDSMRPILPNTNIFKVPNSTGMTHDQLAAFNNTTYGSQAIDNVIFIVTLLSVMSYFLFSFEPKLKAFAWFQTGGRWLLMIGFGAIFGSTVMMRFALLIDRMYFIFIEFLKHQLLHR